jgi:membrane protein YqaA with SNARE-associated domain
VRSFAATIFALVLKFGGVGLLVLGILDSSYLFAPWGNDILVVALVTRHRDLPHVIYYAFMSTVGSVLGCLLIDLTLRPLGAEGLKKHLSGKRIAKFQKQLSESGGKALAFASLAPPPFPFTAFVMAAAALQYPRRRMLTVVAATRLARFLFLGVLALRFGTQILKWSRNPTVQAFLFGLIVVCIAGSILSVYTWIRRTRPARAA